MFYDAEFEEMFYSNVQSLLTDEIMLSDSENQNFLKVIRDSEQRVISMNWVTVGDSLLRSKDFEYFDSGLLAGTRERIGGRITLEVFYGHNQYSKLFYDYVFSPGFLPSNYDHMTEVQYNSIGLVESYKFLTLNGMEIGEIEYLYNEDNHLEKEIWKKGKSKQIIREFISVFDQKNGSFRIIEKDKFGRIVFQDIVNSSVEKFFEKDIH